MIFHLKKVLRKKIESMQSYKRKNFFSALSLIDSCQKVVTSSGCVTNCRLNDYQMSEFMLSKKHKCSCLLETVGRYTTSSWFLLCQTREKPTSRWVVRSLHHRRKSQGKGFKIGLGDRGSSFEQEKLLAQDEEDV